MATKFTPKKGKITGTKKTDKITWANLKAWRRALTVNAGAGNDVINFKKSKYKNNKLNGGSGNDKIYGGTNIDIIHGNAGNDKLYGYNGNDKIYGDAGKDTIYGGAGNDTIYGGDGDDKLYGQDGNDVIYGGKHNDYIDGGKGNDKIYGQYGTNTLKGGAGNDTIFAGTGTDKIYAGAGNDTIDLSKGGSNTVYLESGTNKVSKGGSGVDKIYGGTGNDTIYAGSGNDVIDLSKGGKNTVYGEAGNDNIKGGAGNDTIYGGAGNDYIEGGAGNDSLYGQAGADTFAFSKGSGKDVIYDADSSDSIKYKDANFADLTFTRNSNDLLITRQNGSSIDKVTVLNFFGSNKINKIITKDGTHSILSDAKINVTGSGTINGTDYNDEITGSAGDDVINAGLGNNTIFLNNDNATNTIISGGGVDTLVFSDETDISKFTFAYDENDLNISTTGTNVGLQDYNSGNHSVKYIKVGNKTYNISNAIIDNSDSINGTGGNDLIIAIGNGDHNQVISGSSGDDTIFASASTEQIYTNEGNNTVYLNNDKTTYVYLGTGDDNVYLSTPYSTVNIIGYNFNDGGNDTIHWSGGNNPQRLYFDFNSNTGYQLSDLIFTRTDGSNDLVTRYGNNNSVTLKDYYKSGNDNMANMQISVLNTDSSGTDWYTLSEATELNGIYSYISASGEISGTDNNDYIVGSSDNDIISSGNGEDIINGGAGDDTVILNGTNYKTLYFGYNSSKDTVKFTQPISALFIRIEDFNIDNKNINFYKDKNNLIIQLLGEETESIMTLENFYVSENVPANDQIRLQNFKGTNTTLLNDYVNNFSKYKGVLVQMPDEENTYNFDKAGFNHIFASSHSNDSNDIINVNNGASADFYFYYGSGDDTIYVNSPMGTNYLNLYIAGSAAAKENGNKYLDFLKSGEDLIIKRYNHLNNTTDSVTIKNYYSENNNLPQCTNIKIGDNDGENRLVDNINNYISNYSKFGGVTYLGTENADEISTNDTKMIMTGKGNDTISIAGSGTKILLFEYNSGDDTIVFNDKLTLLSLYIEGVDKENKNLDFVKSGDNLLIERTNPDETVDKITLQDYFTTDKLCPMGIWDLNGENGEEMASYIRQYSKSKAIVVRGTGDVDTLYSANTDTCIYTSPNNDTIIFNTDSSSTGIKNHLRITSGHGDDTVIFQNKATKKSTYLYFEEGTDLEYHKDGDNLVIYHTKNELTEHLTIQNYFADSNILDIINIYNGNSEIGVLENKFANDVYPIYIEGSGTIEGSKYRNIITGSDNQDTIITSGSFNDKITAGSDNDTIILKAFNSGSSVLGTKSMYFHNGDGNDTTQIQAQTLNSALQLYFDTNAQISSYKNNDDFVIARTYKDNDNISHTETVTIENWFEHTYNPSLYTRFIDNNKYSIYEFEIVTDDGTLSTKNKGTSYLIGGDSNNTFNANTIANNSFCYMEDKGGNDTYEVNLSSSKYAIINDLAGINDSLTIQNSSNLTYNLFFEINNVVKNGEEVTYDALSGDLYITYNMNSIQTKNAGLLIKDYFGNGKIETVSQIKDNVTVDLTYDQISSVAESVATWLSESGYSSVDGVFCNALGKADNNSTDISMLISQFNNSWQ